MNTFTISETTFEKCANFAESSVGTSTSKYAFRNQFNIKKIQCDIRNGKIGEQEVYNIISKKYGDLTLPDYNIYEKKNKNWDPDLKTAKFNLAVKSQDIQSSVNYGKSWVFQFGNGNLDCDTGVFKSSEKEDRQHYVSFVALNVLGRKGAIEAIVSIDWLKKNSMFKEMKKKNLRGNKVAVYYDDLIKFEDIWHI